MQSEFTVNILLVDDHPENLLSLEAILEPLGANLVRSNSGEDALRVLLEQDFALILLDVQMPGMDGFETASLIRKRRRSRQTPIIFLTAFSTSSEMLSKGYSLGAVDYLHKPIDPVILLSKATVFVDLFKKTLAIQQQSLVLEQQATQLVTANAQLRQSEEQFRLLSEGSPVGIFLTNPQGQFTYTNPRFYLICGVSAPASLQVDLLQTIHPEDQPRLVAVWSAYLEGQQELSDEFRLLNANLRNSELRWVNVRSRPLFSEQQELLGHLGTVEDITARKQAEAMRAEMIREQIARQEAEAINRLKDEFLAVLSHELRTPLNAMMGWAKILSDSFAPQSTRRLDEATTQRGLSIIQRNAQAQTQLIEDLLDVSRIIQGKLSLKTVPVTLTPVLEAAIESVRPQAQAKEIQLIPHLADPEIQVMGDAVRLQQIVWNLISNAIKFTPSGGRVEIRLDVGRWADGEQGSNPIRQTENANASSPHPLTPSSPHPLISSSPHPLTPSPSHPAAKVTITDTGIGISPEFLPHVFDRFQQADSTTTRSYTGLGLGLAIVRHLVELHGGTVRAESAGEGQGSSFTVWLPIAERLGDGEMGGGGDGEMGRWGGGEMGRWGDGEMGRGEAIQGERLQGEATEVAPAMPHPLTSSPPHPLTPSSPHPLTPSSHLSGQKILLVDDEVDSRELLAFVLEDQGATVVMAGGSATALAALAGDSFNALISDISMPGMDGYDLIQKVRRLPNNPNATVPAIALTAHASEADRQRALVLGFNAHLAKPIEPEELLEAIGNLLNLRTGDSDRTPV